MTDPRIPPTPVSPAQTAGQAHPPEEGPRLSLWATLVAVALGIVLVFALFGTSETDFEDFALGAETTSIYGAIDGVQVHCKAVDDAEECLAPSRQRDAEHRVIWLGNSQLHAVNQLQPGQTPASMLLHTELRPEGVDFITLSQPNASLLEHGVLYEWLKAQIAIDVLLLPAVFDDTREYTIRPEIATAAADSAVRASLEADEAGQTALAIIDAASAPEDDGTPPTLQDRVEEFITNSLEACCGLETLRLEARGSIKTNLYVTRNTALGITASSKRPMIPARYTGNLRMMARTLDSAAEAGTTVIVYIAPLRDDVDRPYYEHEYRQFKVDVEALARKHGATFLNIEGIVPGPLWGLKDATRIGAEPEYDFMHFQFDGHRMLADALRGPVLEAVQ